MCVCSQQEDTTSSVHPTVSLNIVFNLVVSLFSILTSPYLPLPSDYGLPHFISLCFHTQVYYVAVSEHMLLCSQVSTFISAVPTASLCLVVHWTRVVSLLRSVQKSWIEIQWGLKFTKQWQLSLLYVFTAISVMLITNHSCQLPSCIRCISFD